MKKQHIRGIISMTRRGVGYVTPEGEKSQMRSINDIEIREDRLGVALNRDVVEVVLLQEKVRGRVQGEVVAVLERAKKRFVGTLHTKNGDWYLSPDDSRVHVVFTIPALKGIRLTEGHKALIEMKAWSDPKKGPLGVVVAVLGKAGEAEVERDAIVLAHGFETGFSKEVLTEAEAIAHVGRITERDIKERRDCRSVPTMTIDPEDAKDFDDALSVRELPDRTIEVGIHIADVSYYVRPGSSLEKEAEERGTSVYMVGETVPMLPEVLSNDLCSLNPNEDKRTFSAVFTLSPRGVVQKEWFGRTVTNSQKRFTYKDAQKNIDTRAGIFSKELIVLNTLAKKIRKERFRNGAIDFDSDEISIILDNNGHPTSITKKERLETHKLVEEFMLLANRRVAQFVYAKTNKANRTNPVFIYRIHDTPKRDKLEELSVFLKAIGYDFLKTKHKGQGKISSHDINALFREIKGTPEENLIKVATVRTMAKAVYTTKNIGHFGLAFPHYTHFTSPIRRYPDIMVHRLLARHLSGKPISSNELIRYEKLALQSSEREMAAVEAERESVKYAQVRYMESHVGEEFDAVISGVTAWGIYVEEANSKSEGLVRLSSLTDDYYRFDKEHYALIGEKNKKKYSLGDSVRIRLSAADPEEKTLDFIFV
jgi:ribonuclease R